MLRFCGNTVLNLRWSRVVHGSTKSSKKNTRWRMSSEDLWKNNCRITSSGTTGLTEIFTVSGKSTFLTIIYRKVKRICRSESTSPTRMVGLSSRSKIRILLLGTGTRLSSYLTKVTRLWSTGLRNDMSYNISNTIL